MEPNTETPRFPHRLSAGGYEAVVSEVGATLHSLRYDGRDLVCRDGSPVALPPYAGKVLVPWPNRIAGGRYAFGGRDLQLPVNEVDAGNAMHGLVLWQRWTVEDRSAASVSLLCDLCPQPGYPFALRVGATYQLDTDSGLTVTVSSVNGDLPAPYGVTIHPYLLAGPGTVDGWTLELDAESVLAYDPARLDEPTRGPVDGSGLDFRRPQQIGERELDHTYTDVRHDPAGGGRARVTGADGGGVEVGWDGACRWVQVYTLELPGNPLHRRALAIEPMTCPPNAFRSGMGLIALAPGERHTASWTLGAV